MKNENTNIMDIFIFQKIPMKFFFTFCIKHKYLISEACKEYIENKSKVNILMTFSCLF